MEGIINDCRWAVAYKIDKETQDDNKTRVSVIALFEYPSYAEEFIENCLKRETEKFFIINSRELNKCDDCDKIQIVSRMYAQVIE